MSDEGPNQTRDQVMKLINDTTKPIIEPIKAQKENVKYYLETGYEHSKRVFPFFKRNWQCLENKTTQNLTTYHHYRREFPWEIITGTSILATICSLPYGAQATARNALLVSVGTTLLVNPEWLYDQYKYYSSNGVNAKDSTNRSTFNW